jgi:predicted nicotinamide N-methyase
MHTYSFTDSEQQTLSVALQHTGARAHRFASYTWPMAEYLAQLVWSNPHLVARRHVVELGAGTGLVGIVAAWRGAVSVTLTDRSQLRTLSRLRANCALNGLRPIGDDWEETIGGELPPHGGAGSPQLASCQGERVRGQGQGQGQKQPCAAVRVLGYEWAGLQDLPPWTRTAAEGAQGGAKETEAAATPAAPAAGAEACGLVIASDIWYERHAAVGSAQTQPAGRGSERRSPVRSSRTPHRAAPDLFGHPAADTAHSDAGADTGPATQGSHGGASDGATANGCTEDGSSSGSEEEHEGETDEDADGLESAVAALSLLLSRYHAVGVVGYVQRDDETSAKLCATLAHYGLAAEHMRVGLQERDTVREFPQTEVQGDARPGAAGQSGCSAASAGGELLTPAVNGADEQLLPAALLLPGTLRLPDSMCLVRVRRLDGRTGGRSLAMEPTLGDPSCMSPL